MALAGGRIVHHGGRVYEWTVRERGDSLCLVVQDAVARGQLLMVAAPVFDVFEPGEKYGDFYARTTFFPGAVGARIDMALAQGWRPCEKRRPPFRMGADADAFPQPWGRADITRGSVLDLWAVLRLVLRDAGWRDRLTRTFGEVYRVPAEQLRAADLALAARAEDRGGVEVFLRVWNPKAGDADPYLAARYASGWPEVLADASAWYGRAEPGAAADGGGR